ncbi:MBL fold metallo-hydrolase [Conyzicola nivalis]|uniref:MBL fold metallo-hydrolase n=1 Tax=Conyzicola nivalis TaxID=1477021 RepID=A0A916WI27_9MICO|nr:MBL fold metallo-hydrolase [Conyzicola nivalis]GGB01851.1 MBL fold metallo-hydrolase [Conyzicola nivalis]
MKLTKHEHATLVLEKANETLVVDPGAFTLPLTEVRHVVAIVITHEHPDHWTPEQLDRILEMNPDAKIYGPQGVAIAASAYPVIVVRDGDEIAAGGFTLRFFGEKHAVIHSSLPTIDNVGVLVDGAVFYPGDSFTIPPVEVDVLAVPAGAPWLKIGEAIDYVAAVKPKRSFPTHQMVLSVIGSNMANDRIKAVTEANGGEFFPLEPGQSLEL